MWYTTTLEQIYILVSGNISFIAMPGCWIPALKYGNVCSEQVYHPLLLPPIIC
ncbi:hypothetical protein M23134_06656 [Microscilla marina ATCC 23134]|uniref:Uncharacterized protein n=1 Tax=Microscilla marina ATCC 23134 TaxID=313606 RepID=A1ZW34_MICM2|nr:hypothetical protein M23134_06656 [Microscilla marina ATCC 23134]